MSRLKYIATATCLLLMIGIRAQHEEKKEKIKALKIAFFTERIGLSSQEAEVFWPLYNAYEEKREALHAQERSEVRHKVASVDQMSEAEANAILKRYLELEEAQEELDKKFYRDLAKRLSASKVLKLFMAEHEFRKRLLREYRSRRKEMP